MQRLRHRVTYFKNVKSLAFSIIGLIIITVGAIKLRAY